MSSAAEWARTLADTITNSPPSDEDTPDVIADLHHAEKTLANLRRSLLSELPGPVAGQHFRIVEKRTASRSYNDSGIIAAAGGLDALPALVASDVARLTWQWGKLRTWFQKHDLPLVVVGHEIGDGDTGGLVGELWTAKLDYEAKPERTRE